MLCAFCLWIILQSNRYSHTKAKMKTNENFRGGSRERVVEEGKKQPLFSLPIRQQT